MTILELHNALQSSGVNSEEYYLHGLYGSSNDNDKPSLTMKRGKYTVEYEIYFCEKGKINSSKIFTDESVACNYFLKQFQK